MMYGVAGALAVLALAGWITGRTRAAHLIAAFLILIAATATLAGIAVLSHPSGGALPPLPATSYMIVGSLLSAYGFALLVAFARRPRVVAVLD